MADKGMSLGGIYAQMRDWYAGSTTKATDFTPGSVLRTFLEAAGVPIEELFYRLYVTLPRRYFLAKAEDDADVEALAADHTFGAITRNPEATASGTAIFTGTANTIIPASSALVGKDNGARYETSAQGQVGQSGTVEIAVTAKAAGSASNLQPSRTLIQSAPITGITAVVTGANGIGGGADRETNADLKKRIQNYFGTIQTGTPAAIMRAALAVTGVKRAFFKGSSPAPGWWTLYVDDGSGGASQSIRQAVYDALLPHQDAEILYEVKAGAVISVLMDVTLVTASVDSAGLAAIRAAGEAAILAYVATLGYEDDLFNDKIVTVVNGADSRIKSATCKFTSPTTYTAGQTYQLYYEDAITGRQQMKNPLVGTLFRAGAITWK